MIQTVRGPIAADELGTTSMHDHVLSDSSRLRRAGSEPAPDDAGVRMETLGYLRWNALASADNLRLDDPRLAAEELAAASVLGLSTVVECTSWGLGPDHAGLPEVSRVAGVQVVSAYGAYVHYSLPDWVAALSAVAFEDHLVEALQVAVPGTEFRAGLVGIMGTTAEFGPWERDMLRAAARAGARTDAAVSVRLDPDARNGLEIIEAMTAEGLPSERILLTNADEYMDAPYWDELADAGAVLEMCFGTEAVHVGRVDNPSDRERLAFFTGFTATHPHARHVLGQSTWTKAQLRAYGGYGYGYLLARIVPELRARGLSGERLDAMLAGEPRRLLDRPERSRR
ncbi:hypothetical protein ACTU6V_02650 [Microbacterium sp. A204]|uniref:phosphotriesterase family protein n=1 Tax=Microbacterium sp. A204 TaxID=3457321 RepID=UPI003FD4C526